MWDKENAHTEKCKIQKEKFIISYLAFLGKKSFSVLYNERG